MFFESTIEVDKVLHHTPRIACAGAVTAFCVRGKRSIVDAQGRLHSAQRSPHTCHREHSGELIMASIIEQIQHDALDRSVRASDLLRRVKLAATKLSLGTVEDWVEQELNGYKGRE